MDLGMLHWARPLWLWALALLPLWAWIAARRARRASVWHGVVDAHLLPHLLATEVSPSRRRARWVALAAYTVAVVALAGPGWRLAAQPLWRNQAPLVVALDLSSAALQRDLPPSRLAQARSKLGRLLQQRSGGQVALVAYAGDAFTVAPLTDDAANVAVFLDALAPDVMPVDGQRIDRAIAWSAKLMRQAGFSRGDVLVMGDHATAADIAAATGAGSDGIRVSVLGVGATSARTPSGFDEASLQRLAEAGGGTYQRITVDDADLHALRVLTPRGVGAPGTAKDSARNWVDEGYWLLPLVMLLVLPAFRRGATTLLLLACVGWPFGVVHAAEWWRRPDQVEHAQLEQAIEQYRRGDYEAAAQGFAHGNTADAHYNRGNALAKAGRYAEAIQAYDQALQQVPGMEDAQANRRAVRAAMQRKPPPGRNAGAQGQDGKKSGNAGSSAGGPKSPGDSQQGTGQGPTDRDASGTPRSDDANDRGHDSRAGTTQGERGKPADTAAQAHADEAQRARMQQALAQGRKDGDQPPRQSPERLTRTETPAERERRIANEAALRRVPDDPGGLLREKFRLEYQRRLQQGTTPP